MKTCLTSVFFLISLCLSAHANDDRVSFVQGGFKYFVETDSTVSISDAGLEVPLSLSADSTLVIPSSVCHEGKTYRVERVESSAFGLRQEIKHLVVSEGVERIDEYAFEGCQSLTDISLPSTLYDWDNNKNIFGFCHNLRRITVSEQNERYDSRDDCNAIINTDKKHAYLWLYGHPDTRFGRNHRFRRFQAMLPISGANRCPRRRETH